AHGRSRRHTQRHRAEGSHRCRARRPAVPALPGRRRQAAAVPLRVRHGPGLSRAARIGGRGPRLGRGGVAPARPLRADPGRVDRGRRRPLAQRHVRQRPAPQRPAPSEQRRQRALWKHHADVPNLGGRRAGHGRGARDAGAEPLGHTAPRAGRPLPALQARRLVRQPLDQPADRRGAVPVGRRGEDPPTNPVREVLHRASPAKSEANRPGGARFLLGTRLGARPVADTLPRMPTCLVTGGAGFLGSHLCDHLLARGHRVICVDNFDTGSLQNIKHLREGDNFGFQMIDITSHYEIDEPVDFVFHMASPASPIDYARLPLHTLKVGAYGTHNTLGLAKIKRARFLLASTSEVYGDPLVHPQPETYWGNVNPIGPRGVYDEAKRYAEALTMAYLRQQGVDTCIARIFNTFGPRLRANDGRAIPAFLSQALTDRPLTVFGDGSQTRSFCYVDDLIAGLIALAESGVH